MADNTQLGAPSGTGDVISTDDLGAVQPEPAPRSMPAWLPGVVLGLIAIAGEVVLWLH